MCKGKERIVCLGWNASAAGSSAGFAASTLRAEDRALAPAGKEIGGRSLACPYHVNSICTGASVGFISGRNPQIGRIRSQMMPTCQATDASMDRPGMRPRIHWTRSGRRAGWRLSFSGRGPVKKAATLEPNSGQGDFQSTAKSTGGASARTRRLLAQTAAGGCSRCRRRGCIAQQLYPMD